MEVINAYKVTKAVDKAVAELLFTKLCNTKTGEHSLKFGLNHRKDKEKRTCSLFIPSITEADGSSRFRNTNSHTSNP